MSSVRAPFYYGKADFRRFTTKSSDTAARALLAFPPTMEAYIETLSNWKALPIVAGSLESDAYGVEFKIPKGEVASIGGDRTCNFQVPHFLKNVGAHFLYEPSSTLADP